MNVENIDVSCSRLFDPMNKRLKICKEESNSDYFYALLYACEFAFKILISLFVAGVREDKERHRHRFETLLVRADGIGSWVEVLEQLLPHVFSGSSPMMQECSKELTQKVGDPDWRYGVCRDMHRALRIADASVSEMPLKVQLVQWFKDFSRLRNKTRGHGAIPSSKIDEIVPLIGNSYECLIKEIGVLRLPLVYLRRKLSGKFSVVPILSSNQQLEALRESSEYDFKDGVYASFDKIVPCNLIKTDVDLSDFFLPNGGFNDNSFEILSYITGNTERKPVGDYIKPIQNLPGSVTDGKCVLDVVGEVFSNMPDVDSGYVKRVALESELRKELLDTSRHPIVTLGGRGGIGKTSSALIVAHEIANNPDCPYDEIIWFSARDIDLMQDGAREVQPKELELYDFASSFCLLTRPSEQIKREDREKIFADALSKPNGKGRLFIFDNFETVTNPSEMYAWIDTYIRNPNKVLITTRVRGRFRADFPIEVVGMTDSECRTLINNTAVRLGIENSLSEQTIDSLIEESGGHPYIVKIMLGEVQSHPEKKKVARIIAGRDDILEALFERTYDRLSLAARRIFLIISGWRSCVSELAVEAVLVKSNDGFVDTQKAVDELVAYSFVEREENISGEAFLTVPLAAQLFGKKKIAQDPFRGTIEEDLRLLQQFGVINRSAINESLENRLGFLFRNIESAIKAGEKTIEDYRPIIEYVARKIPQAWLFLADLCCDSVEDQIQYLTKYLESDGKDDIPGWKRLRQLHQDCGDCYAQLNDLTLLVQAKGVTVQDVSWAANTANYIISNNKDLIERVDRKRLVEELAGVMIGFVPSCNATDLSRLAWLYMHLNDYGEAERLVNLGLSLDGGNRFCAQLRERLVNQQIPAAADSIV